VQTIRHLPAQHAAEWLARTISAGTDDVALIVVDITA
jgi:hypothetical protein